MPEPTHCFHCHEPIVDLEPPSAELMGATQVFCCPGCHGVAVAICDNGLQDYYRYRTEPADKANLLPEEMLQQLNLYDMPSLQESFVVAGSGEEKQIQLSLDGVNCAACAWLIERQVLALKGVRRIGVDVSARRATLSWLPQQLPLSKILEQLELIGYHARPFQPDEQEQQEEQQAKSLLRQLGTAGLLTMQVMMIAFALYFGVFGDLEATTQGYFHWTSLLLSTPVVFYSGATFYRNALSALSAGRVNMDVPVSVAIMLLYGSSMWSTWTGAGTVYFESVCMFVFLLLISRLLEHRSRRVATLASANNNQHIPITARRMTANGKEDCLARELVPGDCVQVLPGELVPVDGILQDTYTQVDEAMLTGEFAPVSKHKGDLLYGGTLNQGNSIQMQVSQDFKHSMISQITRMQELAMGDKPRIGKLADKIASHFVVAVLSIAALSYVFWYLYAQEQALWVAVAVLVATCPCALALATPTALTTAMGRLRSQGMLLRRGDVLEGLSEVDSVIFDKTGTLTQGNISIHQWHNHSELADEVILQLAASLESYSEHPIAQAFTGAVTHNPFVVDNHQVTVGKGVSGDIDGSTYRIGSKSFTQANQSESPLASVFLTRDGTVLASFELQDTLREDAPQCLNALSDYQRTLLSGDLRSNVQAVAQQLPFSQWYGEQLPEDKLAFVSQQQAQGAKVLMIGDGVNDGPVLAKANVSVAVQSASDLAKNAADVILLNPRLNNVPELLAVATLTRRAIKQNMLWAIGYNTLALPLAISGILAPWMAVLGMSASSIIVVFNSMRVLKQPASEKPQVVQSS